MSDRKAELERKKARLQALREEKDRRRREKELKDVEEAANRVILGTEGDRKELDEMLSSLGVAPVSDILSSISSANSLTPDHSHNHTPDTSLLPHSSPNNLSHAKKRAPNLSVVQVQSTNIPPKETVLYTKQTQTTATGHERDAHATDYYGEDEEGSLPHLGGFGSKLPPGILPHGLPQVKEVQPAVTALEQEQAKQEVKEVRELSEEEKQMIILSEDFQHFVDRAGRVMERVLCENVDYYTDYSGGAGEEGLDEKSHQRISLNRYFFDERWSRNRCVTSMDWSPQFPELLLASYNNNEDSPNDPDGVVLIWNTKFKKATPEYIFHCQSAVLSAKFARFHPNLILGGTYSGQIVLWDNRVQKRTPIQRTPLSASAHTHPVYCLSVVGTQNAHNLISISTDGRLCSWSLDMLGQPQETLDLHRMQSKPVAVTCLDFPHSDVNNFVVGSEEGAAYSACRHGAKAGITDTYDGHQGPITGISVNSVQGGIDFSHMFLTSSIDWTIKLWSLKDSKPIYSFEDNGDYVLDVKWSPAHPALFAAVDGSGRLDLWNLNQDTEVPAASVTVEGNPALNRISWTPSGLHVTVGDNQGKIWVYDVAENFAHPRHDEWNKFLYTTQELRNNQVDEELEKLNYSVSNTPLSSMGSITTTPLR
ncbi:cytoplasmic dynein 1 intermediate chain isoform X23 [Tribolium castaneum]|uniref:cytoplasmic dynein 1 intermediate chain isoform X23 n=1 Tax=Tribolium castaneum TaxID=7070 RepID=UPI00046C26A1|nr:PREDICTED: cytoplasmic dynein 1 intermediate chain isoform X21 [Tribolium castaneum]|eukprot:XP_008198668.1 PREDICTED: cytoplasmic dynein 1 intermediate chain isoform X21 [Tribolium castaneum]